MCLCLGKCVVRYILVSINLIFFLIGAALAIAGGILLYQMKHNPPLDLEDYNIAVILMISLGCVIAVISAMGWCGACAEMKILLYIYSAVVLILAGLQIYAVVKLRSQDIVDEENIRLSLEKTFYEEKELKVFHALETTFKCCGPTGPDSYADVYDHLPPSCCLNATEIPDLTDPDVVDQIESVAVTCRADDAHPGCDQVLANFVSVVIHYVGLAIIVVIAVELLAIVMAISLSCCVASPKTV